MAVVGAPRVATAVEALGAELLDRGSVRDPGVELVGDLLCVVYRLVYGDLARQRGVEIAPWDAVAGVRLRALDRRGLDRAVLTAVAEAVRCPGRPDEEDHAALGELHESMLSLQPVV